MISRHRGRQGFGLQSGWICHRSYFFGNYPNTPKYKNQGPHQGQGKERGSHIGFWDELDKKDAGFLTSRSGQSH